MEVRFYQETNGNLRFRCPCGAFVDDENPETSLGGPMTLSDAQYRAESECGACGRDFLVNLSGTLTWKPHELGDLEVKSCRKCEGDEQYCHTCGEIESVCACDEASIGTCDHCEGWWPSLEQARAEGGA